MTGEALLEPLGGALGASALEWFGRAWLSLFESKHGRDWACA